MNAMCLHGFAMRSMACLLAAGGAVAASADETAMNAQRRDAVVSFAPSADMYNEAAGLRAGDRGTVGVRSCIDAAGKVTEVRLEQSSGNDRVDAAGIALASQYRFEPATEGGHAVAQCVVMPIAIAADADVEAVHVRKPAKVIYQPEASSFNPVAEPTLVRVKVCMDQAGMVRDASVLRSSDNAELDKGAVRHASRYRFEPATIDGVPQAGCVSLPVVFSPPVRWKPPGFPGQIEALRGP